MSNLVIFQIIFLETEFSDLINLNFAKENWNYTNLQKDQVARIVKFLNRDLGRPISIIKSMSKSNLNIIFTGHPMKSSRK